MLSQYKNLAEFGQAICLRGRRYKLSVYSHFKNLLVIKTSDYSLTENISSSCSCLVYRGLPEPSTVKSPFAQSSAMVLNYKRVDSDREKKFFMMRMLRHWQRLPREAVDAPALETLKAWLDRALSNLILLKMSLFIAGGLH